MINFGLIISISFFLFGFLWIPLHYLFKIGKRSESFSHQVEINQKLSNFQKLDNSSSSSDDEEEENENENESPKAKKPKDQKRIPKTKFFTAFGTVGFETKRLNNFFHKLFGPKNSERTGSHSPQEKDEKKLQKNFLKFWFRIGLIFVILAGIFLAIFLILNSFTIFSIFWNLLTKRIPFEPKTATKRILERIQKSEKKDFDEKKEKIGEKIEKNEEKSFAENLKSVKNSQLSFVLLIPGLNIPLRDSIFIVIAMFVAVIFHELGHAISAVVFHQRIKFIGFRAVFWMLMAYVSIETENLNKRIEKIQQKFQISQKPLENEKNIEMNKKILKTRKKFYLKNLIVDAAGVWHNIVSCFLIFLLSMLIFKNNFFKIYETVPIENYEILFLKDEKNEKNEKKLTKQIGGVFVHENKSPAVFPNLGKGDVIEGIRSYSQDFQYFNNIQDWYKVLFGEKKVVNSKPTPPKAQETKIPENEKNLQVALKSQENEITKLKFEGIKNEPKNIGYLIPKTKILEEFNNINKNLECCNENSSDPSYLCFFYFEKAPKKRQICLKAREVIQYQRCIFSENSKKISKIQFDNELFSNSESLQDGFECVFLEKFDVDEKIIELKVRGKSQTLLFLGDVDFLAENVIVSEMKINEKNEFLKFFKNFIKLELDLEFFANFEKILGYFVSLSSGLAILNTLPLRGFDGDYILDQLCEIWFVYEIEKSILHENENSNKNVKLLKKKEWILKFKFMVRICAWVLLILNVVLAGLKIIF